MIENAAARFTTSSWSHEVGQRFPPRGLTRITCARIIVSMNVTLSIDDDVIREARRRAEAMGTSVNQLVREYLEQLVGKTDPNADAAEFERLSYLAQGDSHGWKFNRDELHERK